MTSKSTGKSRKAVATMPPVMSEIELARLGGGEVAYIKPLSAEQANKLFPMIEGLPKGINLYSLHAADGTPIALTDTMQAAIGHAEEGELAIAGLH
jgi:hypothetical protein